MAAAVACALLLSGATFGHARSSAAQAVSCGAIVTTSVTLTAPLDCPATGGISAGANNIVINLNGQFLEGGDMGNGVGDSGFSGVTIENGTIEGFNDGVGASNATNIKVEGVRVQQNATDGIAVAGSSGALISGNIALDNSSQNITVTGSGTGTVTVEGNRSVGAFTQGIAVGGYTTATVESNVADNNTAQGIEITGATSGTVESNVTDGNQEDGLDITVVGNQPKPLVTVAHNRAAFNTGVGISAFFVIDGGGNVVQSNGNAVECIYVACDAVSS